MRTAAIVPAAGSGKRLGFSESKPFVLLKGRPIAYYTLKALGDSSAIDAIVIACEKRYVSRFHSLIKRYRLKKVIDIVIGGKTRLDSVKNCLNSIDRTYDIVLIHDVARPLVTDDIIKRSVREAKRYGACVTAIPETDTVKVGGRSMFVKRTLDRSVIFRAQTPQVFKRELIKKAYNIKMGQGATDDSAMAEAMGKKVKIVAGSCRNIKITTKEDLKLAEVLI
ncbi:MAG: 2-C-methyl-D-erythritol 4-phosphate cytidylyltransferase [Candidatus Omnitrophota bacterium]|jgi:2-C-methyl-D-erythritol 4-phosphate cytidylyltransferase